MRLRLQLAVVIKLDEPLDDGFPRLLVVVVVGCPRRMVNAIGSSIRDSGN